MAPKPQTFDHYAAEVRRALWRIKRLLLEPETSLETIMSALDDATSALAGAVTANTAATASLITALESSAPTQAQLDAIAAQTSAVEANTKAINDKLAPPAPPAEAAPAEGGQPA